MVHGGLGLRQLWLLLMLSTNPWADRDGSGTVGKLSSTAVRCCWARPGDSSRPGHCTARAGHAQAPGRWRWQWQSRWFDCLAWRGVAWRGVACCSPKDPGSAQPRRDTAVSGRKRQLARAVAGATAWRGVLLACARLAESLVSRPALPMFFYTYIGWRVWYTAGLGLSGGGGGCGGSSSGRLAGSTASRGVAWRAARLKTRGVHSPDGTRRLRAANAGLPGQWSARWRDCLACSCCSPADPWDCTAPAGHGGSRPQTPASPGCGWCDCLAWRAARL